MSQTQIYKDVKIPPGRDERGAPIPADQKDQSSKLVQSIPMTRQQKEMTNDGKDPIGSVPAPPPAGNRPAVSLKDKSAPSTAESGGIGNMGMFGLAAGALAAVFAAIKMMPK